MRYIRLHEHGAGFQPSICFCGWVAPPGPLVQAGIVRAFGAEEGSTCLTLLNTARSDGIGAEEDEGIMAANYSVCVSSAPKARPIPAWANGLVITHILNNYWKPEWRRVGLRDEKSALQI